MSVPIEEVTLVAPRDGLEANYPGGVAAFIHAARGVGAPPTFACNGDVHLVSLGFRDHEHARPVLDLLAGVSLDWVLVDAAIGPLAPAEWLRWSARGGVARAWRTGTRPGRLAPAHPASETLLRLAVEGGVETFLDLETGAQIRAGIPADDAPAETPIHDALIRAIETIGWSYHFSAPPFAIVDLVGATGLYSNKFSANEVATAIVCFTRAPLYVPLPARRRVMEFITRANFGMHVGSFELGLDDGLLGIRAALHVHAGAPLDDPVRNVASNNVYTMDRYTPNLMEVIYAKQCPREAVEAAEQE